jgi:hypothetical protein
VHLDRDPGDADGVLLRRHPDVLGARAGRELVDGEVSPGWSILAPSDLPR